MQFYVNDFDGDTCGLSSSAVGVWIRMLIAMHRKRCGELSGTLDRLAKITRCTVPELEAALKEFETDDICYMKRDGNGVVTIVCRRLKREEEKRASTSERVRRFRERKAAEQENAECNADVTPLTRAYSQSHSHIQSIQGVSLSDDKSTPSPEPEKSGSPGAAAVKGKKIFFDYDGDGKIHGITSEQLERWREMFPALDVNAELRAASAWLDGNRKNRKTDVRRFLTNWLIRHQDSAKPASTIAPRGKAQVDYAKLNDDVKRMREERGSFWDNVDENGRPIE